MDHVPAPGAWPLSAAATAVLRAPQTPPPELLRLTLRELVVRGVVRVQVEEQRRRAPTVRLAPGAVGAAALPAPLRLLAEALRPHLAPDGTPAHAAVRRASGWRTDLGTQVRQAARDELVAARLLQEDRRRLLGVVPWTRWELTPSGRVWARSAADAAVSAATLTAGALPAAGLLLALDQDLQRRLRDASGGGDTGSAGWPHDDLDQLDAVLGEAGPALDSAADGGSSGGGDGGGDGGGGGGGD